MGFESKKGCFFLQFLVDILPLGSGSVDPHIIADPDPGPGSQYLADPTIRIRILSTGLIVCLTCMFKCYLYLFVDSCLKFGYSCLYVCIFVSINFCLSVFSRLYFCKLMSVC